MRLEWLEDILAVVETGSFSEAAERRGLTQSTFSRRIKLIEDHVGVELFDRGRKPVQLTAATADQEDKMRELAKALRDLTDELRVSSQSAERQITIVAQNAIASATAPVVIQHLVEEAQMVVRLLSGNHDDSYALLVSHDANIALAYQAEGDPPPGRADFFETQRLGDDRLIAVTRDPVDYAAPLPMIAYPRDFYMGRLFDRFIRPHLPMGVEQRTETTLTTAALEMAQEGIGVAWVPVSLATRAIEEGRLIWLKDLPQVPMALMAVRPADRPSAPELRAWESLATLEL